MEQLIRLISDDIKKGNVKELAKKIGMNRTTLYMYASGQVHTGKFDQVMKLCIYYGVDPYKVHGVK